MIRAAKLAVIDSRDLQLWAEDVHDERQGHTGHARAIRQEDPGPASDSHG
jgi:hypothetical protein